MNAVNEAPATSDLSAGKKTPPKAKRDWLKSAGWAKDDALYAKAAQLGQEYRRSMTWESEHAHS
jgi:hypothetical protein